MEKFCFAVFRYISKLVDKISQHHFTTRHCNKKVNFLAPSAWTLHLSPISPPAITIRFIYSSIKGKAVMQVVYIHIGYT